MKIYDEFDKVISGLIGLCSLKIRSNEEENINLLSIEDFFYSSSVINNFEKKCIFCLD